MKKIIFTGVAVLSLFFVKAQEVKFGVKAGLNLANLTNLEDSSMKTGFHAGGFVEIKLNDKFAVQPELLYSTQGAKVKYTETYSGQSTTYKEKVKTGYLNIPIMAKYFVSDKFSLEAGPQIGFLMSAKDEIGNETENIKKQLKSTDFGLNIGLGYDFTESISANVRYNLGLSEVQKEKLEGDESIKNSVFQLSLGYKF